MSGVWWCLVGAFLALGIALANDFGGDSLSTDQKLYCEMVKTFKETNGQFGWPDYRGIDRKVCSYEE